MNDDLEGKVVRARIVEVDNLEEGMICVCDVTAPSGAVLLPADAEIEQKHIDFFKALGVDKVEILVPKTKKTIVEAIEEQLVDKKDQVKKVKVLVVDDSKLMKMKLTRILGELELDIVGVAGNGLEAVELANEHHPDLVTMDIEMPEMDGIEATELIMEAFPETTIVMISSLGQEEKIVECYHRGAKDFIVKPFDSDRVKKSILEAIPAQS